MTATMTDIAASGPLQPAADFLKAVHGGAKGFVCIWTSQDRASRFFANNDAGRTEATKYAILQASESDVYFGLGLFDKVVFGPMLTSDLGTRNPLLPMKRRLAES
jgi:hypothetical protein